MGKDWDKAVPSVEIWKECLRILKDGAFAFVMSAPRLDTLAEMGKRLEQAGFKIGFTPIFHTFATGFPKAMNIGKAVDKRGKENEKYSELSKELCYYLKKSREKLKLSQKDIAKHFLSKTGGLTGCVWNWENGANIPTMEQWIKLKEILKLDNNEFIELIERAVLKREEAEREIISRQPMTIGIGGNSPRMGKEKIIDIPETPQAKQLDGSYAGFQPKPAVEVIIVAMKPLSERTYVDQALSNGKGVTWLDECRIPTEDDVIQNFNDFTNIHKNQYGSGKKITTLSTKSVNSRFPANLLVSDDVLNDGRISKGQQGATTGNEPTNFQPNLTHGDYRGYRKAMKPRNDSGSYSRYFSLDKWAQKTFPFAIIAKASKSEKNKGLDGFEKKKTPFLPSGAFDTNDGKKEHTKMKNFHPTVKPLKLMSYLITLGSRRDDIVLDPFIGSGTTAIAAKTLGRKYIGFELNEEYHKIAEARIKAVNPNLLSF